MPLEFLPTFCEIIHFGIALNISAALGSFLLGYLEDIFGIKNINYFINRINFFSIFNIVIDNKLFFWILGISLGFL